MKALFATTALILASSMAFAQPDDTPPGLEKHHGGVAPSNTKADPQGPVSNPNAPSFTPAGRKG